MGADDDDDEDDDDADDKWHEVSAINMATIHLHRHM